MKTIELTKHEVERRLVKARQRVVLESKYPDYNPKHHEVFLAMYREEEERAALRAWMKNRGIE